MSKKDLDTLRNSPLYNQTEASLYLGIPRSSLRYWAFGESRTARSAEPLIETPKGSNGLSFFNLVELHLLDSLRREYDIDIPKIRKSLRYLKSQLKSKRPLLDQHFETDGVGLFVRHYGELLDVSKQGQATMRSILAGSLKRVERDSRKIPVKLFPYTHSKLEESPRVISMTPELFSGRPVIDGTGIATGVIAERYKAGDSIELLAADYRLKKDVIEEAIRCELKVAA